MLDNTAALLTALVESSQDAIWTKKLDGEITSWNASAQRVLGYSSEEMVGKNVRVLLPPEQWAEEGELLNTLGRGKRVEPFEAVRIAKDGAHIWMSLSYSTIKGQDGAVQGIATIARDIRERIGADIVFRQVFNAARSGMVLVDSKGIIALANTEAELLFGYPTGDLIGRPIESLVPARYREKHVKDRDAYFDSPVARPMGIGRDLFGVRKDESEIQVEIGLQPLRTRDGSFILATVVDITERKQVQARMAEQSRDLERSNSELEQFAYVASHDLQEPLRMVVSYTELLQQRYKGKIDEKADKYIRYIVEGGKRMQLLVSDLLTYSRVGRKAKPFAPVRSEIIVGQSVDSLSHVVRESGARFEWTNLPIIMGDEVQLRQLFQNLFANSVKFRSNDPPLVRIAAERRGRYWEFCVSDNGIGIDMQFAERIFQMFQRLHERDKYEGSGIGLALVKKIVERHGGQVRVESKLGQGAAFYFTLPAAEKGL